LNKDYTEESYNEMFTLRVKGNLEKIERIKAVYQKVPNTPDILFKILDDQKQRLSG